MKNSVYSLPIYLFLALCVFLFAFTTFVDKEKKWVSGYVYDMEEKPIDGASIQIDDSGKGTLSDSSGYFEILIPNKSKILKVSKWGFEEKEVTIGSIKSFKIYLKKAEVSNYEEIDYSGIKDEGKWVKSKRSEKMRDAVMEYDAAMAEPAKVRKIPYEKRVKTGHSDTRAVLQEKAGQMTAGEWNDLNNWEAWLNLINEADYKEMEQHWGIEAHNRVSVFVTNQYELPISDCIVDLLRGGKVIWSAKTDNAGKAELWINEYSDDLELKVQTRENSQRVKNVMTIDKGVNRLQFNEECNAPVKADIMFVVDATGSMGDEIEFLKAELSDVIEQVEGERSDVEFRWGSIFYRDKNDDYLTRQLPLSAKESRILHFIKQQSAGGGGDYPEAVNEGLEDALMQEWSEEAIARIVFLVLDAPPHHDQEVLKDLQSQIAFAAAMGVKIIPVTASGINRQTEYLMKFMSIMTNGTYVFITDDSGIGNKHLDPIVDDFDVEFLNELLVRLIGNYTDPGHCVQQEETDELYKQIEIFPNPVVHQLNVRIPKGIRELTLNSSSGQLLEKIKINGEDNLEMDLSKYVDGMYLVNLYSSDKVYTFKVIKTNRV